MEIGTRRIVHFNLTAHPTAEWTAQQFREAIPSDHSYRFLIRDRDSIFSGEVDQQLKAFGLRVLRTPARAPQANAYCERLVGTVRREELGPEGILSLAEETMAEIPSPISLDLLSVTLIEKIELFHGPGDLDDDLTLLALRRLKHQ